MTKFNPYPELDDQVVLVYEHWNQEVGWVTKEKVVSRKSAEGLKKANSMTWKYVRHYELDIEYEK
jgi:hypothetical protein